MFSIFDYRSCFLKAGAVRIWNDALLTMIWAYLFFFLSITSANKDSIVCSSFVVLTLPLPRLSKMKALLFPEVGLSLWRTDCRVLPQDLPISFRRQISYSKLESFSRDSFVNLLSECCLSEMFLMGLSSSGVLQGAVWGLCDASIITQHSSHKPWLFRSLYMVHLEMVPNKLPIYQF